MAVDPRVGNPGKRAARRLSVAEAGFYAEVYSSARKGSLAELRRKGCTEEEAEEYFSAAFQRVMETVDPLARDFSPPQMVNFVKRAAWRCMLDERRRRGLRPQVELGEVKSLTDPSAEGPAEIAEVREAIAIGHEALQMLPERDRLVFRQRHQMNLTPEEIVHNTPGLSLRTYRKIIQRANARVLDVFERIEDGRRCEELESGMLRRYVAEESKDGERPGVEAHLAHCRACRKAEARMRGYLLDVASGLLVASALPVSGGIAALGRAPAWTADLLAGSARALAEVSRAVRERGRDLMLRLANSFPGSSGDAAVSQGLATTTVNVSAACANGVMAAACVAAGVVPGLGGAGLLEHRPVDRGAEAVKVVPAGVPSPSTFLDTLPPASRSSAAPGRRARPEAASPANRQDTPAVAPTPRPVERPRVEVEPGSVSSARESGTQTGNDFGAEASQPATPPPTSAGKAPSPQAEAPAPAQARSSSPGTGSGGNGGSEFGF